MAETRDVIIGGADKRSSPAFLPKPDSKRWCSTAHTGGRGGYHRRIHPGFRFHARSHRWPSRADIVRDMQLGQRTQADNSEVNTCLGAARWRALVLLPLRRERRKKSRNGQKDATLTWPSVRHGGPDRQNVMALRSSAHAANMTAPTVRPWGMLRQAGHYGIWAKKQDCIASALGTYGSRRLVAGSSIPNLCAPPRCPRIFGILGPWYAGSSLVLMLRAAAIQLPAGSE